MRAADADLSGWSGAARPDRMVLDGTYARLEPLDPDRHARDLLHAAQQDGAAERFRFLFDPVPSDAADFAGWLDGAAHAKDAVFFAVIDKATGRAEGRQALMRIDQTHGVIEIGNILWGPTIARTRIATEAFFLTASYVFDTLGYRRLEWKCDDRNAASKSAAARFGFTFEGVFRCHMVVKGKNRDTAWFSIIAPEWPRHAKAFADWLDASNFDHAGRQRRRLGECADTS